MLRVQARSISGLGYYFDSTYAARVAEAPGGRGEHYGGRVADRLDLDRISGARAGFATLLSGRDPATSEVLDAGHNRVRHAFFDVVFTSPKSVSLLYALSEPPIRAAVLLAHERARDATLEYLERRGAWVKTLGDDRRNERAEGLCWRAFVHHTSRSGDPHLHSHVLVANLVPSEARGWSPFDSGPFYAEQRSAEALFGAALRFELHDSLGVEFRSRTARGSDVAGFSDQVIDAFSQRANAIRAARSASRDGLVSRAEFGRGLRPDKVAEPPIDHLVEAWRNRARGVGIVPERDVPGGSRSGTSGLEPPDRIARAVDTAVLGAVAGFCSSFSRSELIVASARALEVGVTVPLFESRVDAAIATPGQGVEVAIRVERSRRSGFDQRGLRRYATETVRAAISAEDDYCSSSLQLSAMHGEAPMRSALTQSPAVVLADIASSPLASYDAIRRLREAAFGVFAREQIVAPSPRSLSRFEAATGAVGGAGGLAGREEVAPRLMVIVDAYRFDVARRAALTADGLSSGGLVVLCDLEGSRAPLHEFDSAPRHVPEPLAEARWYRHGSRSIAFTSDLSSAIGEVESLGQRLGSDVVVVADDRLASLIGGEVVVASGRSVVACGDAKRAIVLGDAASVRLPLGLTECTYVMASPLVRDRSDERALAYALMTAVLRRQRVAVVSLGPSERLARGWSMVTDLDRGAAVLGLGHNPGEQRSKEWGLEGRGERDRAHLGPE
jgi:conjugative relaxase-like TrwC/TraI family protein